MPDGIFKYDKRGKPTWGVRLKFKDHDGKWQPKERRSFTSQRDAKTFRDPSREEPATESLSSHLFHNSKDKQ